MTTKKITLATVKSFIRKAGKDLHISCRSAFDGMTDGIVTVKDKTFAPIQPAGHTENTLGIQGAWFVGGSRNYFNAYNEGDFTGYEVSNCCGSFVLAKKT